MCVVGRARVGQLLFCFLWDMEICRWLESTAQLYFWAYFRRQKYLDFLLLGFYRDLACVIALESQQGLVNIQIKVTLKVKGPNVSGFLAYNVQHCPFINIWSTFWCNRKIFCFGGTWVGKNVMRPHFSAWKETLMFCCEIWGLVNT